MTGALVAVAVLVAATAAGLLLKARDGRVRARAGAVPADVVAVLDPAAAVTLVQFSTTFCAPCRHTRVVLSDLAARTDGLAHADVDLTDNPDLAARMRITRTPTTVAVSREGGELLRVDGVPKAAAVLAALADRLPPPADTGRA